MTPWEKHNIKHISASSLSLFRTQPALWCLKYLVGFKDDAGASAWRGSAVEAGLSTYLYKRNANDAEQAAYARFEKDAQGEVSADVEGERDNIKPMLTQAITACQALPTPVASQLKIETWLDGVSVPVVGYVDFLCDDVIIDLKTTKACPSEIKPDHNRQVSLYLMARQFKERGRVLYVTGKKHAWYDVTSPQTTVDQLRADAVALQNFLGRVSDGQDALSILAPDLDHFMWSDTAKQTLQQAA